MPWRFGSQVSLGDFACAKKASKSVLPGAVRCVAAWAVEKCPVVDCLWKEDKQAGTQVGVAFLLRCDWLAGERGNLGIVVEEEVRRRFRAVLGVVRATREA